MVDIYEAGNVVPEEQVLRHHPLHKIRPVGAPYVLGRWHKDRASVQGYAFEARVFARTRFKTRRTVKTFLMLGRPRSGTTVLGRLLNQVDAVRCDGEVLHHAVLSPRRFLNRLAQKNPAAAYGAKLLTYQMLEVQRLERPERFLEQITADGFRLIHIRRHSLDQALSLSLSQMTGRYHIRQGRDAAPQQREIVLDPAEFLDQLRWNIATLDYEDRLLARFPHLRITYEDDLRDSVAHQATVDRICDWLGVPSSPVKADLRRTSERNVVANMDALREAVLTAGYPDLL